MFIQTQTTPNPQALKFLLPEGLLKAGTMTFTKSQELSSKDLPQLVRDIFDVDGIEGIFMATDFISLTKSQDYGWDMLKPLALAAIMDHFLSGAKMPEGHLVQHDEFSEEDKEVVEQIKELLETKVRPAVAQDGGDIVYNHFKDGVLYLELHGACSGCPSSQITLKQGIENMLRHYIPEVLRVESI